MTVIIADVVRNYGQGLPRLRPAGAGCGLRPGGVRAEPRPDPRAPGAYQRTRPPPPRRARAVLVRGKAHREPRRLPHGKAERADLRLRARRRLARGPRARLCVP